MAPHRRPLRDVWAATSHSLMSHLIADFDTPSLAYKLVGITDVRKYLVQNGRSLTVSIYQRRADEYHTQCAELAEYVADPTRENVVDLGSRGRRTPYCGIRLSKLSNVILDWMPNITSLHFVLVDCLPTYWYWYMDRDFLASFLGEWYPDCLTDLHLTFAHTSPPPPLPVDAPRGTFFPPRCASDRQRFLDFIAVKRLVVRDANVDFVAFLTTYCPSLERIESTAQFGVEDLPPEVPDQLRDRFVFRQLAPVALRTGSAPPTSNVNAPLKVGSPRVPEAHSPPAPKEDPPAVPEADSAPVPKTDPPFAATEDAQSPSSKKKERKKSFLFSWRIVRRAFQIRI